MFSSDDEAGGRGGSLFGGRGCGGSDAYFMEFDEDGSLALARALGRALRDLYSGDVLRPTDQAAAESSFKGVAEDTLRDDPARMVMLATAVAAPTESNAPVLDMAADHLRQPAPSTAGEADDEAPQPAASAASDAKNSRRASALRLLRDIRRTYTRRE